MTEAWDRLVKPADLSAEWREILLRLPGYDSIACAADCRFDVDAAKLALDFFPECLRHVEGELADKPFRLEPWERSILANLMGWKRIDEKGRIVRRYREVLIYIPRKNGKTPFIAGVAILILFTDDEAGQQDYIAAGEREQAALMFRHASGMIQREPELRSRCRIFGGDAQTGQARSIVRNDDNSFLKILSADAKTKHGGNTHLAIIEELHVQANRELVDVLTTSTASVNRKQPLTIYVTTADYDHPSICNEKHDYACGVRDGRIPDTAFLPVVYEAAKNDDWTKPETWAKANPNLGVSVSADYLARECEKAKLNPALENTFKRFHLNIKTEEAVAHAIDMAAWDLCGKEEEPGEWRRAMLETLRGQQCRGGLDLGSTSDLTAAALLFGDEPPYIVLPWFWIPADGARKREHAHRVPYAAWVKQGFITETAGNVTDYAIVRRDLNALAEQFGIAELAVDRVFQGAQLCTELMGDGFELIAFGQGFYSMAAPVKRFGELVATGELHHGNNPVLRWMASNCAGEQDAAGNIKFSKNKSRNKIDGIIATVMALGRAMVAPVAASGGCDAW